MELPVGIKKRGFGSMTLEQRREIASRGGKAVPAHLRTFSRNNELAVRAGKMGGRGMKKKVEQTNRETSDESNGNKVHETV